MGDDLAAERHITQHRAMPARTNGAMASALFKHCTCIANDMPYDSFLSTHVVSSQKAVASGSFICIIKSLFSVVVVDSVFFV